ncbi:hypothetical protein BGZ83_007744 [Gryganskiella cystojenkinii]|nr:hypothetical protein BGZ83_007744 [Gryganskiella cystojenkinii]
MELSTWFRAIKTAGSHPSIFQKDPMKLPAIALVVMAISAASTTLSMTEATPAAIIKLKSKAMTMTMTVPSTPAPTAFRRLTLPTMRP